MIGKMIEKLYQGKEVHIFISNFGAEHLQLSQVDIESKYYLHGRVVRFHDEFGVLELETHSGKRIYVNQDNIDAFFDPEVNLSSSIGVMIKSGKKLKRDFE
jgi:hypothetical protein